MKKGSLRRSEHEEVDGIGCRGHLSDTWYDNDDNVIKNALSAWRSCDGIEHINRVALLVLLSDGVRLQAGKPPRYATSHTGANSASYSMRDGKCLPAKYGDALQLEYRQPGRMAHLSLVDKRVGGRQNCMIPR